MFSKEEKHEFLKWLQIASRYLCPKTRMVDAVEIFRNRHMEVFNYGKNSNRAYKYKKDNTH